MGRTLLWPWWNPPHLDEDFWNLITDLLFFLLNVFFDGVYESCEEYWQGSGFWASLRDENFENNMGIQLPRSCASREFSWQSWHVADCLWSVWPWIHLSPGVVCNLGGGPQHHSCQTFWEFLHCLLVCFPNVHEYKWFNFMFSTNNPKSWHASKFWWNLTIQIWNEFLSNFYAMSIV